MRKEFIIAIISGITIGIVVAFGIWRANTALKSENSSPIEENVAAQNQMVPTDSAQLTIIRPEEDDVVTSSPVKVSGITKPETTLVVSGEQRDYIIKSNEDGSFEVEVDLLGGVNEILFAHQENGNSAQIKSLRIIYSTEFEKEVSE
jgi:hypothetical protein